MTTHSAAAAEAHFGAPSDWLKRNPPRAPLSIVVREIIRVQRLRGAVSVLDLGHGRGAHWEDVSFPDSVRLTSVDASNDWTPSASMRPISTIEGVVPGVLFDIPSRSFDLVMAFDLIEHLPKSDGYLMLYEMQRIAREAAIIYTPNGHVWQPPSPDNPWNAHISGWTPREMKRLGWTQIHPWRGLRVLTGPYGNSRMRPRTKGGHMAAGALARVSAPLARISSLAYSFTAVVHGGNGHRPFPDDAWDPRT